MTRSLPIALITAAHTLIWLSIQSCVVCVLGAGLAGRSDRSVAIAGAVVACESMMIFAANGFRCPLTDLAESHGVDRARSPASTCRPGSPATSRPSTCRSSIWPSCCTAETCGAALRSRSPPPSPPAPA